MKNSDVSKRPPSKADNPYLHAREEYASRYGSYVAAARNWRLVAVGSLCVSVLLIADNWHLANKAETMPYIVSVDHLGQTKFEGVPSPASADNPLIIKGALETWVRDARSIIADPHAERHNIDTVYCFISRGSPAYRTLTDWYSTRQPFEFATRATVDITNLNALPVGNVSQSHTWTVTWDETQTNADGTVTTPAHWTANITYSRSAVRLDDPRSTINPIGLLITNYSWAKQS
ncbi:VirB8/TrbF family protein [Asaia spathodeae]|nr:VirB8/TrbF family protein [Asaia spathodeae]